MRKRLSKNAIKSWVIEGAIATVIAIIIFSIIKVFGKLGSTTGFGSWANDNAKWINIVFVLVFIYCLIETVIAPTFSYKQWSYSINDEEIWYREGIFWSKEVLIPIVRIQNINLKEGPISKSLGIADITIGTAGGSFKIPALDKSEVDLIMEFLREKVNENVKNEQEMTYGEE
ncbi:MAG: PH domain-containing protein [Sarcina sp.]